MLVIEASIREANIFEGLKTIIKNGSVKSKDLPDLFDIEEYAYSQTSDQKYSIMVTKNLVSLYFPAVVKKVLEKEIKTSIVVLFDKENDDDEGESLNKILSKFSIKYSNGFWYGAFISMVECIQEGKRLGSWEAPTPPVMEFESDFTDYSQDDLDDFLGDGDEDDLEEFYEDDENDDCSDETEDLDDEE